MYSRAVSSSSGSYWTRQIPLPLQRHSGDRDATRANGGQGDPADWCARAVRDACRELPTKSHLNYTGGTKAMAAHARMAFREQGGADADASYLDERDGVIRCDDGREVPLDEHNLDLSVEVLLQLHGSRRLGSGASPSPAPTPEDLDTVVRRVLSEPSLATKLYRVHRTAPSADAGADWQRLRFSQAKENPEKLSSLGVELSIDQLPDATWTKKTYECWRDWLHGCWLEEWVGELVRQILDAPDGIGTGAPDGHPEVAVGVNCDRQGRKLEIDVIIVRGHRVYVISCTTDVRLPLCKSKAFEVAMRARQVGGDLARAALVCLLHGGQRRRQVYRPTAQRRREFWEFGHLCGSTLLLDGDVRFLRHGEGIQ